MSRCLDWMTWLVEFLFIYLDLEVKHINTIPSSKAAYAPTCPLGYHPRCNRNTPISRPQTTPNTPGCRTRCDPPGCLLETHLLLPTLPDTPTHLGSADMRLVSPICAWKRSQSGVVQSIGATEGIGATVRYSTCKSAP